MGVASLGDKDCCSSTAAATNTAGTGTAGTAEQEEGPDYEGARYYLETALQMMNTCREEASREAREAGEQDCSQVTIALHYCDICSMSHRLTA